MSCKMMEVESKLCVDKGRDDPIKGCGHHHDHVTSVATNASFCSLACVVHDDGDDLQHHQ